MIEPGATNPKESPSQILARRRAENQSALAAAGVIRDRVWGGPIDVAATLASSPPARADALRADALALSRQRLTPSQVDEHVARVIRNAPEAPTLAAIVASPKPQTKTKPPREELPRPAVEIRVYPDLLAAATRGGQTQQARLYLLARSMDHAGRGVVTVDLLRERFTRPGTWHAMSWRRMREVLAAGRGIFWTRDREGRLWLPSPAKIAAALGVARLTGSPVDLKTADIVIGGHRLAAAFFTSWHAARGEGANPISRATLHELTGASESSQRRYDQTAKTTQRRNLAILGRADALDAHALAWEYGRAVYTFVDHLGRVGEPGAAYVARNLPASYEADLFWHKPTRARGRLRKANRHLKHLVTNWARGKEEDATKPAAIYHQSGHEAGKVYNRNYQRDHFVRRANTLAPTAATPPKLEGVRLWDILPSSQGIGLYAA